jgi:hypothetical protein
MQVWFLTLAAGVFAAAEGSPALLLVPPLAVAALWLAARYVRHNCKRSWVTNVVVAPVLLLSILCVVVVGAVAAQAWRNVCRGYGPFASSGDDGTRLGLLIALIWVAHFASSCSVTKSKAVSVRLAIALITPALVVCPVQIIWAI